MQEKTKKSPEEDDFSVLSEALDAHHGMEEGIVVEVGAVTDAGLVGIDSVDGVVQYLADLVIVVDTESDEGEDTQFGGEEFVTFDGQCFPFAQEGVEIADEVGEDMEERLVELLVEVPSAVMGIDIIGDDDEFIRAFLLGFASHESFIAFEPADEVGHATAGRTDILLFDAVGLHEFVVHGLDGALCLADGAYAVDEDSKQDEQRCQKDIEESGLNGNTVIGMFECQHLFLLDDRQDTSDGELSVACVVVLGIVHRHTDVERGVLEVALQVQPLCDESEGDGLFGGATQIADSSLNEVGSGDVGLVLEGISMGDTGVGDSFLMLGDGGACEGYFELLYRACIIVHLEFVERGCAPVEDGVGRLDERQGFLAEGVSFGDIDITEVSLHVIRHVVFEAGIIGVVIDPVFGVEGRGVDMVKDVERLVEESGAEIDEGASEFGFGLVVGMPEQFGFVDHLVHETEGSIVVERLVLLKKQHIFVVGADGGILLYRLDALMLEAVVLRFALQFVIQLLDIGGGHGKRRMPEQRDRCYE